MKINLSTGSLARASATHPWLVICVWIGMTAASLALIATLLGDGLTTEYDFTNNSESKRGRLLIEEGFNRLLPVQDIIVVRSPQFTVEDPIYKQKVSSITSAVLALGRDKVSSAFNFYLTGEESFVGEEGHSTIIPIIMTGDLDQADDHIKMVIDTLRAYQGVDGFEVYVVGAASLSLEWNELATSDREQGERVGIPVAAIILLVLFGALVAALVPLLLAGIAIIVALGATALVGLSVDLIFFVTLMVTMIGLAVGIDYSLIFVSRFREELRQGKNNFDAVVRAGETAGRTVFFSGVTVVVALAGMLVIPSNVYQALAIGAILVVVAAVTASLTLLPASLAIIGQWINLPRIPFISRLIESPDSTSYRLVWDRITRIVMKYPTISVIAVGGVLIAATLPAFTINTGFNGIDTLPDRVQSKQGFLLLDEHFSFGFVSPSNVVVSGAANSTHVMEAIDRLKESIATDTQFAGASTWEVNAKGDLGNLTVAIKGEPSSDESVNAVIRLRDSYIPDAFSGVDAEVFVTGFTASNADFFDLVKTYTPIVFVVVLGLSFPLLMVAFRSVVIPLKAIIMNLLSVGAAYGLMVLVFQHGIGADIGIFDESPIIDAWIPLFMFSVLFGLSMDYHVFLLSRVRERYDQTGDNFEAVSFGLRSTAGLITGAALIMVAVFSGFASGEQVSNQQVGFGLAAAVFIDATLVRSILVPASMRLLGNWNWYLPKWLRWIPDIRVEADTPRSTS